MAKSTLKSEKKPSPSLEEDLEWARAHNPHHIKVDADVLQLLQIAGVSPSEACAYFIEVFNKLKQLPFNGRYRKIKWPGWILRDQFPSTDIYFKLTGTVYRPRDWKGDFATDHPLLIINVTFIRNKNKTVSFKYESAEQYLLEKAEFYMLGIDEKPKDFIHSTFKRPRKMRPKGYK